MRFLFVFLSLLLVGCVSHPKVIPAKPGDTEFTPPQQTPVHLQTRQQGNIHTGQYMLTLFQDRRAYRVGDVVMIMLSESTQSDKSAATTFGKDSDVQIPTPSLGSLNTSDINASISASRDFEGAAASSQQNALSGVITVVVHDVLPNGLLHIKGEKWLELNQGAEYIRLSGYLRAEDIDSENRVYSSRVADARITYSGTGALADSNEAGWLTQLFNSPWIGM